MIWSILKTYLGQKWRNIFVRFLVQMMKTSKFAFEIIWPLVIWLKKHLILKKGCGLTDMKQREYLCVQIRIEKYTTLWLQIDSIWMKAFFSFCNTTSTPVKSKDLGERRICTFCQKRDWNCEIVPVWARIPSSCSARFYVEMLIYLRK